jgi:ABC-type sugar transport system permease subunit
VPEDLTNTSKKSHDSCGKTDLILKKYDNIYMKKLLEALKMLVLIVILSPLLILAIAGLILGSLVSKRFRRWVEKNIELEY